MSVSVAGGAGGIEARYDDMTAAARLFGRVGVESGERSARLAGYLMRPDLLAGAVLDPVGAEQVGELLGRVVAQLTLLGLRCGAIDVGLRAAAAAYLGVDRLEVDVHDRLGPVLSLPGALLDGMAGAVTRGGLAGLAQVLADDPGLADLLVTELDVRRSAGALALLLPDGHAAVTDTGTAPVRAPGSLADLIADLATRNDGVPGAIDVTVLPGADGRRHVVVDIPGTKSWSLAPHQADVTSLTTDLRAVSGGHTTYEAGVLEAMRRAGVRPEDDVVLVGHSEGGLIALAVARDGPYRTVQVVTAGAPLGLLTGHVRDGVQVLALENAPDVVPHLDGLSNGAGPNVTTVTVHHQHSSVLDNHDLRLSYLPGARDVDASDAPSVRAYLAGLDGLFRSGPGVRHTYVVSRSYR